MTGPDHPGADGPGPLRVLMVCQANLCRSPAAEYLLRWELAARELDGRVQVASAGLRATDGTPMDPPVAQLVAERGMDPTPFRSRVLTDQLVKESGLVLTATRELRSAVLERVPLALRRTFTLLEFAHGLDQLNRNGAADPRPVRPEWLVAAVAMARSQNPPEEYDVLDPIGRSEETYKWVIATIHLAVWQIAEGFAERV